MNAIPLLKCLTYIVIFLSKDTGKPNIHRLRLINTNEAGYDFILKFFLA